MSVASEAKPKMAQQVGALPTNQPWPWRLSFERMAGRGTSPCTRSSAPMPAAYGSSLRSVSEKAPRSRRMAGALTPRWPRPAPAQGHRHGPRQECGGDLPLDAYLHRQYEADDPGDVPRRGREASGSLSGRIYLPRQLPPPALSH